jgi:hypothetical protein
MLMGSLLLNSGVDDVQCPLDLWGDWSEKKIFLHLCLDIDID